MVRDAPDRYRSLLVERDGSRPPAPSVWSPIAYVCHVADNTRIWGERVWQTIDLPGSDVSPYDQDALAVARRYDLIPQTTALWSLEQSVTIWERALAAADLAASLRHPEYGVLGVVDVARRVAHEVHHHELDIRRGLGLAASFDRRADRPD